MKCLITGATGFVGLYLLQELKKNQKFNEIYGIGFKTKKNADLFDKFFQIDITKQEQIKQIIKNLRPDTVFHLAGQSFILLAEKKPICSRSLILDATCYLLESLEKLNKSIHFLYVSSCLVYGKQTDFPISEDSTPFPNNHYSTFKYETEQKCMSYKNSNVKVFIARPFNHIGIGQKSYFLIPNLSEQILQVIQDKNYKVRIGNLSATRDFLDVRDVVSAYRIIEEKGNPFEIYNVCSSEEFRVKDILEIFRQITKINIEIIMEEKRLRRNESLRSLGDNTKIKSLSWDKKYNIQDSIGEIYLHYLNKNKISNKKEYK